MTSTYELSQDLAHRNRPSTTGRQQAGCVLLATAAALLVWVAASPIGDLQLTVGSGATPRDVGPGSVALASLLAGLSAVGLASVLARTTTRPRRIWQIFAILTLAVSLLGPLGAATTGAGITLATMHLLVGAILYVGVGRTLPTLPDTHVTIAPGDAPPIQARRLGS